MSQPCSDFDLLEADIRRQAKLLAGRLTALRRAAAETAAGLQPFQRVYLVSCGDGLSASLAAAHAWEGLLDCPVEAVPAMTFAGYTAKNAAPGSLAVFISQSGKVVRMMDALALARRHGLQSLVITSSPMSPLAQLDAGSRILDLGYQRLGFVPGTSAYTYTLAALYELAAALGKDPAAQGRIQAEMDVLPEALEAAIQAAWVPAAEFAGRLSAGDTVFCLGSGPFSGTAHYTMRKLFEICQLKAVLLETEEYAHDAYYAMDAHTPAILYAPPDGTFRRCAEVAGYLDGLGCPLLVVSAPDRNRAFSGGNVVFMGLPSAATLQATLTYPLAAQTVACLSGRRLGGSFYACNDPQRYESGDSQIYESARMDLDGG